MANWFSDVGPVRVTIALQRASDERESTPTTR